MTENILVELAIIMATGILIAGIISILKQPLIIGYIIAGIVLGPNVFNIVQTNDAISTFAQLGLVILMFTVGLNLSPKVFREVGKVSLLTGFGQIIFTALVGFLISGWLDYDIVESLYIAIALTFSSTIIIMKVLSDKDDLETLYGKISVGFLLVQDVVAMIILAVISSSFFNTSGDSEMSALGFVSIFIISALLIPISIYIMPKIVKKIAKSQEYLLLFSIGWCLLLAILFYKLKFSMEIGALLAGISLSNSIYRYEMIAKVKSIRDFFIFLFFVSLGSTMNIANLENSLIPIIIFSLFVIIGKPLIVMIIMGRMGYTKKTLFSAGLTVAQVSEFSFILITLGMKVGGLNPEILSMVTMIGLITIATSTYAMMYSDQMYPRLEKLLSIFERKNIKHKEPKSKTENLDIILFGYDKIGYSLLRVFKKMKWKYLIIDYNPEVIKYLENNRVKCMYGDAEDTDMLNELQMYKSKMVISTIPDYSLNSLILKHIREHNDTTIVLMVCNSIEDSLKLYNEGASYVIIPRFLGGEHASALLEKHGFNMNKFIKEKVAHLEHLGDRKSIVHFNK